MFVQQNGPAISCEISLLIHQYRHHTVTWFVQSTEV